VERRLGRGGMGEVFLAWDERLERRVAIKRIRLDAGLSNEQRERFRREARLAARLSHRAIVQIHDLVTEGSEDAIVLEYVEGHTLTERLAAGRMEMAEALSLAREIAAGLAAAHGAGLIHRDLKAANVIVTRDGQAKILDFGLARALHGAEETPLTRQGIVVGTLHTMSPEQARGREVDERSDLFSFGVLLYEMLTGRLPFQGEDCAAVLWQVAHEPPPRPRSLRPDLPAAAESLLERLLAKDRRERPGSAREVMRDLERIAPSRPAPLSERMSDLPTAAGPQGKEPPSAMSPWGILTSTLADRAARGRWAALTGAALILLTALGVTVWQGRRPLPPSRVAVAQPEVQSKAGDEQLRLAATGVLTAELSSLASLQGMTAIDPRDASRGGTSPMEMTRTAAANEALTAAVEREGTLSRVSLRRVRGSDGAVLWTETFRVPADPGGLRLLNDAVAIHLRRAYPDHPVRPGTPELDVRDEDYAAFLEIRQRVESGEASLDSQLARVEEIVRQSPRFLEGQILAARAALGVFQTTLEPADLDRAARRVQLSRDLAPDDPRPLLLDFKLALAAGREQDAEEVLARIERRLPGDPDVLPLRARLAQQQGRPAESLEALRTAAAQVPSWENVFLLARLEAEQGHIREAREQIGGILRQAPDNPWARELLGSVELYYGDLAKAEEIFLGAVRADPRHSWTALGVARFLRGRYTEAAEAFYRALDADPAALVAQLNLAETEVELGHRPAAEALWQRAMDLLTAGSPSRRLGLREAMFKAQCLARLGRTREAVEIAQETLRRSPKDPEILYQSAFVYSLAGDRTSALNSALEALERGVQPRWFTGSAFRSLREDPELRPLLQSAAAPAAPH
jgi:serine/threonine-protein kinase